MKPKVKTMEMQLSRFEWIKAKLIGELPTRFHINKGTRISIYRPRPADLQITFELKTTGFPVWQPAAKIHVNATLGEITTERCYFNEPSGIIKHFNSYPGKATKYV